MAATRRRTNRQASQSITNRRRRATGASGNTRIPRTAEEKMASDAARLNEAAQAEAAQARLRTVSRGALGGRRVRAGGMDLARYDMARYVSDPFPRIGPIQPTAGTGGGTTNRRNINQGNARPKTTRNQPKPKPGPTAAEKAKRQREEAARRERERLRKKRTDTGQPKKAPRPGGGQSPRRSPTVKMRPLSKPKKMQISGHYRAPQMAVPGTYNKPRVGRVGKQMPQPRKFSPTMKPQRPKPRFPAVSTRRAY